jgi:UDP-N-acetylmuramoyl-L-alanine---L-glutamate ligase
VRFSELDGRTVGVWGAGREIRSFATQLRRRLPSARIAVVALDDPCGGAEAVEAVGQPAGRLVTGAGIADGLAACEVVVRSPGVSIYRPELGRLAELGIHVTTATGLWLEETGGRNVIGVTGTKGKSTTAMLAFELARAAGQPTHLAGNIGVPVLDLLDRPASDLCVIELSSYQIADLRQGPEVAVLTNLFPEHVDWHESDANYRADKLRLLSLPGVRASAVNGRDTTLAAVSQDFVNPTYFGRPDGWDATAAGIAFAGSLVVPSAAVPLRGAHNALNLCAALTALELAGVGLPTLPEALHGVRGLRHRLEVVADRDGVLWVDDSISTTPESTLAALESFSDRAIVLIGGGQDRSQDYAALARELASRDATVIGLPLTGSRLVAAARAAGIPDARATEAADMQAAVTLARELARPGTAVLLSPAAPSYNTYRNFEERGRDFLKQIERSPAPPATPAPDEGLARRGSLT